MAGKIDDHSPVDCLAGQTAAAGARQEGHTQFCRQCHRRMNIFHGSGNQNRKRHHLINAGIGAIKKARVFVQTDVALKMRL